jgi:two-component system cell cycle response regulator DivK
VSGKVRVCLVEDYPDNRVLISAVLRGAGMEVTVLADAESVQPLLDSGYVPDVFLLDLSLPGEDGASLMTRLKASAATAGIPVLALTAHAMSGDAERGLARGFDGYITKPIEVRKFPAEVLHYIEGGRGGLTARS